MNFTGFSQEGLNFLAELAENNEREWFNANKKRYIALLQEPAQAFIVAMGERLQTIVPAIRYDTKTNGSGSLMRIYRDIRFSADKTPYNTHVSMIFWEGAGKKTQHPGFYFRVTKDGGYVAGGQFGLAKEKLKAFREAVDHNEIGQKLAQIVARLKEGGYEIGGSHYKNIPRGYDKAHPRADLLKHNGLYASSETIPPNNLASSDLIDICFARYQAMASLQQWLAALN